MYTWWFSDPWYGFVDKSQEGFSISNVMLSMHLKYNSQSDMSHHHNCQSCRSEACFVWNSSNSSIERAWNFVISMPINAQSRNAKANQVSSAFHKPSPHSCKQNILLHDPIYLLTLCNKLSPPLNSIRIPMHTLNTIYSLALCVYIRPEGSQPPRPPPFIVSPARRTSAER